MLFRTLMPGCHINSYCNPFNKKIITINHKIPTQLGKSWPHILSSCLITTIETQFRASLDTTVKQVENKLSIRESKVVVRLVSLDATEVALIANIDPLIFR